MLPKGDRPHVRYLLDRKTHLAYRRLMKTLNNSLKFEASSPAQFKLHVIEFSGKYGVAATLEAFKVKRSTFFYWKKKYKDSGNKLISLVPESTRPKTIRKMKTDWRLVAFIKQMRLNHGTVGAPIIKPFLDEYAAELGISSIAIATIEKVIRRRKFTFEKRHRARRKTKYQKLRTRKSPQAKNPGFVEIDMIHISINNKRQYFVSIIDIFTRFALVRKVPSPSSKQATLIFQDFQNGYHHPIHTVQTDNGSEFLKTFHVHLEAQNIKHIFIYPNSPKLNGVVERFNRTVQEEFINRSDEIYYDQEKFKLKLNQYLYWYNYKRPHSSLGYQSPMQFMQTRV
jgi:transposase InsO family protein/transposase-like protein